MALIGAFGTYAHNTWQTLFATAPASPGSAGVPLPDGSRLVVELAPVHSGNWDDSPAVTWVDITAQVTHLAFLTGDTSGALSRWTLEQFTITSKDLTALLGDFVDYAYPGTGPAPGMFARWGIVTPAGVWTPRQSGLVDTLSDIVGGRVRGWTIKCYSTLAYYAGIDYYGTTPGGGLFGAVNINTAIGTVLSDHAGGGDAPWPWAETLATQDAAMPTTVSAAKIAAWPHPKLKLLHRLADSQGMRLYSTPYGGIYTEAWTAATATPWRISDETTIAVAGHPLIDGTRLATGAVWVSSQDRQAGVAQIGTFVGVNPKIYTKWFARSDIRGWPLSDYLCPDPSAPQGTALATAFLSLLPLEVRLDRVSVDTARDATCWALLTDPSYLWIGKKATFERRRPGPAWREATVYVNAVSGIIDFATGVGHAQIDYTTRIVA